jgi:hypothetical protein
MAIHADLDTGEQKIRDQEKNIIIIGKYNVSIKTLR